ncbi:hypothetical protein EDC65_4726 [Stella humosa]|uniref:Glucosyltransferase GtrII-like protein n=1 Tax=Stella humosa TaxID=94 RepID=A0A3N1L109_9PROT|nr:hypothetical protein [Stella humosa]ROP83195.1 hypothetical protein EDC65_4726 [Stella humosa]BBK30026.1 hypothetical protein STHU_06600 [Stella humosa]
MAVPSPSRVPFTLPFLGLAAAILLLVHMPLAGACYGFVDDYVLAQPDRPLPDWPLLAWIARDGRPLYGILLNIVMAPVGDVCDLRFVRVLCVLLEAGIATQLFALARRHGWPLPAAGALALLMLALPGFAVAAAWATLIGPLAAVALGLGAAWFAVPAADERPSMGRLAAAACLLAAALSLYQPGAMAFFPGIAVALARRPASLATLRDQVVPAAVVFVAVVAAYALFYLALPLVMHGPGPGGPPSARAALAIDPWGKLVWFLGVPLRQAVNLFNLEPVPKFGFGVMAVVALGTLLRQRRLRPAALALAAQAGLVVLAYLPNLVVAESWPALRTSLPMAMTMLVVVAAALMAIAERLGNRAGPTVGAGLLAGLAVYGFAVSGPAIDRTLVRLQRAEWQIVLDGVRAAGPLAPGRAIMLVPAGTLRRCAPWRQFDELGLPSTIRPWAADHMVRHAWRAVHGEGLLPRFHFAGPGAPSPPLGAAIIDVAAALAADDRGICR